jgi:hypothetical protein
MTYALFPVKRAAFSTPSDISVNRFSRPRHLYAFSQQCLALAL